MGDSGVSIGESGLCEELEDEGREASRFEQNLQTKTKTIIKHQNKRSLYIPRPSASYMLPIGFTMSQGVRPPKQDMGGVKDEGRTQPRPKDAQQWPNSGKSRQDVHPPKHDMRGVENEEATTACATLIGPK